MEVHKIKSINNYDLMAMIECNQLRVTGSESYNSKFGPEEACNPSSSTYRMFGGILEQGSHFYLQYEFETPILMCGYGLQIADDGIDPLSWKIYVDVLEDGEIMTKKIHVIHNQKWDNNKNKAR